MHAVVVKKTIKYIALLSIGMVPIWGMERGIYAPGQWKISINTPSDVKCEMWTHSSFHDGNVPIKIEIVKHVSKKEIVRRMFVTIPNINNFKFLDLKTLTSDAISVSQKGKIVIEGGGTDTFSFTPYCEFFDDDENVRSLLIDVGSSKIEQPVFINFLKNVQKSPHSWNVKIIQGHKYFEFSLDFESAGDCIARIL